jgi:O-acetyl-ADP-ribose deacetylase (regulator of RNase III)
VRNALKLAKAKGYRSIAFPLIGAGSGGGKQARVQEWMEQELRAAEYEGEVRIVRFRPAR